MKNEFLLHPWGYYSERLKNSGFLKPFHEDATGFLNSIEPSSRRAVLLGHKVIVFNRSSFREYFECIHIEELKCKLVKKLMYFKKYNIVQEEIWDNVIHVFDPLTILRGS